MFFRYAIHPSLRVSIINTYVAGHNITLFSGVFSMKLATNIHHVSGHCWKGFHGQDELTYNGGGINFEWRW